VYTSGLSPGYAGLMPDLIGLWYEDAILKTESIYFFERQEREFIYHQKTGNYAVTN